eukprot:363881-Chlamydomonas_euryale.AAC.3
MHARTNAATAAAFEATGHMHEKYDARRIGLAGGGGEYVPQVGRNPEPFLPVARNGDALWSACGCREARAWILAYLDVSCHALQPHLLRLCKCECLSLPVL